MENSQTSKSGMREHWGQNLFVRIIITKETNLPLRGQLHRVLGTLLSPFKGLSSFQCPTPSRPMTSSLSTANPITLH